MDDKRTPIGRIPTLGFKAGLYCGRCDIFSIGRYESFNGCNMFS